MVCRIACLSIGWRSLDADFPLFLCFLLVWDLNFSDRKVPLIAEWNLNWNFCSKIKICVVFLSRIVCFVDHLDRI